MKLEPTEVSFLITLIQNDAGQNSHKTRFQDFIAGDDKALGDPDFLS